MRGGSFNAEFATDGSGHHRIYLPADADMHDVLALGPVIRAVRDFVAPTVESERYTLVEAIEPPDLTG